MSRFLWFTVYTDFSFVLSQSTRLTDRQTDRRTDRQKSHRKIALHSMQRGKNTRIGCRSSLYVDIYRITYRPLHVQGAPPKKKMAQFLYTLTSSNINRFSKLFYCQNQEKISNNTITKDPTTSQVCRYTTL